MKGMFIKALSLTLLVPAASIFADGQTVAQDAAKTAKEAAAQTAPATQAGKEASKQGWGEWASNGIKSGYNSTVEAAKAHPYIATGLGVAAAAGIGYGIYRYVTSDNTDALGAAGAKSLPSIEADRDTLKAMVAQAEKGNLIATFKLTEKDALPAVKAIEVNPEYAKTSPALKKPELAKLVKGFEPNEQFVKLMSHVRYIDRYAGNKDAADSLARRVAKFKAFVKQLDDKLVAKTAQIAKAEIAKEAPKPEAVVAKVKTDAKGAAGSNSKTKKVKKTESEIRESETRWYTPTLAKGLGLLGLVGLGGLGYYGYNNGWFNFSKAPVAPEAAKAAEQAAQKAAAAVKAPVVVASAPEAPKIEAPVVAAVVAPAPEASVKPAQVDAAINKALDAAAAIR